MSQPQNDSVPEGLPTGGELLRAAPKTLISTVYAGIVSFFGMQHYVAETNWFKKHARGPDGHTKMIESEMGLERSLKQCIYHWMDDETSNRSRLISRDNGYIPNTDVPEKMTHPLSSVTRSLRSTFDKYGLETEAKWISDFENTHKDILSSNNRTDRNELFRFLEEKQKEVGKASKFIFSLLLSVPDGTTINSSELIHSINSRYLTLGESMYGMNKDFFHNHNKPIIKKYQLPFTAAITGATALITAKNYIQRERTDKRTANDIAELKANQLSAIDTEWQGRLDEPTVAVEI